MSYPSYRLLQRLICQPPFHVRTPPTANSQNGSFETETWSLCDRHDPIHCTAQSSCYFLTNSETIISYQFFIMFKTFTCLSMAASVVAFSSSRNLRPSTTKLSMGLVGSGSAEGLAGQTAPLGYFDPLGLSTGKTDGEIKVQLAVDCNL
jgi:hypothetical protein